MLGRMIARQKIGRLVQPWKIICICRDPISIVISLHFMEPETSFRHLMDGDGRLDNPSVLEHFIRLFDNDDPSGWGVCRWFDDVFRDELGIDVYEYPFDVERGYTVIKDGCFSILLLRFEDLATAFSVGVAELLGVDPSRLTLLHSHIHKNDRYAAQHQYIKTHLKLSRDTCNKIYATKLVSHFYSASSIERLTQHWTRGS